MPQDPNDPNQQNNTSNTAGSNQYDSSTPGSSSSTPGTSSGSAGPGTSAPTTPGTNNSQYNQARQQKGTGFTNIQQILNANQGYGQKIGQQIGQGLQSQTSGVNNAINTGQNAFNTAATSAYNTGNSGIQAGAALEQQAGESSDAYANRLANSQGTDYSAIGQGIQNAQYTGPNALSNADQIQSQAATASALGRLAGTTGGQDQLLSNMVAKRGNYSQGDASLDQLLLGQGGEQYVQQGAQALNNIGNTANQAIAGAQNQASNYQNAIANNKQQTLATLQDQLSGAGDSTSNGITGFTTQAANQATQFNTDATRYGQLLSGTNSDGTAIDYSNLSGPDKALLQNGGSLYGIGNQDVYQNTSGVNAGVNASQYGLDNSQFASGNTTPEIQAALAALGSSANLTQGGSYYQGNQSQAAQNLATLLGQSDVKNSIANNQFNTDVFNPTAAFSNNQLTKGVNQQLAGLYGNDVNYENQYNAINPNGDTGLTAAGIDTNATFNNANPNQINVGGNAAAAQSLANDLTGDINTASGGQIGDISNRQGNVGWGDANNALNQANLAAFAQDVAISQAGGQGTYSGVSNNYNTADTAAIQNLQNQTTGSDTTLQNYILKNLLNSGGATS